MTSFTSTSFSMSVYFYEVDTAGVLTYFGLYQDSFIKFRYLLILKTFPNKYMSISKVLTGISYSIAANSNI